METTLRTGYTVTEARVLELGQDVLWLEVDGKRVPEHQLKEEVRSIAQVGDDLRLLINHKKEYVYILNRATNQSCPVSNGRSDASLWPSVASVPIVVIGIAVPLLGLLPAGLIGIIMLVKTLSMRGRFLRYLIVLLLGTALYLGIFGLLAFGAEALFVTGILQILVIMWACKKFDKMDRDELNVLHQMVRQKAVVN